MAERIKGVTVVVTFMVTFKFFILIFDKAIVLDIHITLFLVGQKN